MIYGYSIHHLLNGHGYLVMIQEIKLDNMVLNYNHQSITILGQENFQHQSLIVTIIYIYLEDLAMILLQVNNN